MANNPTSPDTFRHGENATEFHSGAQFDLHKANTELLSLSEVEQAREQLRGLAGPAIQAGAETVDNTVSVRESVSDQPFIPSIDITATPDKIAADVMRRGAILNNVRREEVALAAQ